MSKEWTATQVLDVLQSQFDRLNEQLVRELSGFPELYATQVQFNLIREQIELIRGDHVQRREIDEVKTAAVRVASELRQRLDEQSGRRSATMAAISVVATILALMFGFMWNSQLTGSQVSDQIQREAPWNKDKVVVTRQLQALEAQNARQALQISQMQTQIKFFCATRTKAGLPGC